MRLHPLQRAVATRLLERAPHFFIAKEAALVLHGGHRPTDLLDLHAVGAAEAELTAAASELEALARELSLEIRSPSSTPVARRWVLRSGDETVVVTLRLQPTALDSQKVVIDGLRVDTKRELAAWLLSRLGGEQSLADLVDLGSLLKGASLSAAISDAWTRTSDAQPAMLAWALGRVVVDPMLLAPEIDVAAIEQLRVSLHLEAERQAADA